MKFVEKLEILNSMDFVEISYTHYGLFKVLVKNDEYNRTQIEKIVKEVFEYQVDNKGLIDITEIAYLNCCAAGFKNGKFVF